jgi:hypothetical protein
MHIDGRDCGEGIEDERRADVTRPNMDDAGKRLSAVDREHPEVGVVGEHDTTFGVGEPKNRGVVMSTEPDGNDGLDILALLGESLNDFWMNVLVG